MAEMAQNLGIIPIGYVPKLNEIQLPSRHLGLVTAGKLRRFRVNSTSFQINWSGRWTGNNY